MKEKLYSIKRNSSGLETDKSFRVSKRTLLNKEKRHRLEKIIASLENGDFAGKSLFDVLGWQDETRFNLGIFSYFLTEEEVVKTTASALRSLFRSMRAGGVVVIIGAVAGKYRKIYKGVARIAKHELMQRIMAKHSRIPCISADMYIKRIKQVYERVWRRLELSSVELDAVKAVLPHDLWDAEVPLQGSKAFGLRVFRRQNIKPGRHSWYQRKYAMARRKNRRHR